MQSRRLFLLQIAAGPRDTMVRLPGATFTMGRTREQLDAEFPQAGAGLRGMLQSEAPAHQVTIPPFAIDRNSVTNGEFYRFVQAIPEWRPGRVSGEYLLHWNASQPAPGSEHLPVVHITWDAAAAYAEWARKRLPTEAEWEFAARGGMPDPKYPWGNEAPSPARANFGQSKLGAPVRAGSYPANPYGIHDLAGNVWHFCLDPWGEYPADPQRQTRETISRMSTTTAERRVIRGGSFGAAAFQLRVTARDSHRADNPVAHVGFRCARSL